MEGAGEDPYLGSQIARPVKGFQGDDLKARNTILALRNICWWFC
jgi:hypothetical protein